MKDTTKTIVSTLTFVLSFIALVVSSFTVGMSASGCAHAPVGNVVKTNCGLSVVENDWLKLSDVQAAEDEVIAQMAWSLDERLHDPGRSCASMSKYVLFGNNEYSWPYRVKNEKTEEMELVEIVGLTNCSNKTIEIGRYSNWRYSSIHHELVHVMQDCSGHYKWGEFEIFLRLSKITYK